jgi:hypothetical protein
MSPKQVWSGIWWRQEPSCFLSVTWHGEAFYRLGVQGVEDLILLGVLFTPSVAPSSQQDFGVCFCTLVAIVDASFSFS